MNEGLTKAMEEKSDDEARRVANESVSLIEVEGWAIKEKSCDCGRSELKAVFLIEERFLLRDKSAPDPLYFRIEKHQTWVRVKITEIAGSEIKVDRKL